MIQERTILNVADNSGARKVICIKVLGGSRKRYAKIGDIIKIAIKDTISHSKVKKGEVLKAVVIRTKKETKRTDGSLIKFDKNSCILLNENEQMVGTRVFGPILRELKGKFLKIVSLSSEVL